MPGPEQFFVIVTWGQLSNMEDISHNRIIIQRNSQVSLAQQLYGAVNKHFCLEYLCFNHDSLRRFSYSVWIRVNIFFSVYSSLEGYMCKGKKMNVLLDGKMNE